MNKTPGDQVSTVRLQARLIGVEFTDFSDIMHAIALDSSKEE